MTGSRDRAALTLIASIWGGAVLGNLIASPFGEPTRSLTTAIVTVAATCSSLWMLSRRTRRPSRSVPEVDEPEDSPIGSYLADAKRRYVRLYAIAGVVVLVLAIALFAIGWVATPTIAPTAHERGRAPGPFIGALFGLLASIGFFVQAWKVATSRTRPG